MVEFCAIFPSLRGVYYAKNYFRFFIKYYCFTAYHIAINLALWGFWQQSIFYIFYNFDK